jgi:hypothetical protein
MPRLVRRCSAFALALALLGGPAVAQVPAPAPAPHPAPPPQPSPQPAPSPAPAPPAPYPHPGPAPPIDPIVPVTVIPRAVITTKSDVRRAGSLVVLRSEGSVGLAYEWDLISESDAEIDPSDDGRKCDFATGKPGKYTFKFTAFGSIVEGRILKDTATRVITIEPVVPPSPAPSPAPSPVPVPVPGPDPSPGPQPVPVPVVPDAPVPVPLTPMQQVGRDYGLAELKSYADTWRETATMLAAGSTRRDVMGTFTQRWQARRTPAFAASAKAFAAVAADNVEPTGPQKDALVKAMLEYADGLMMGVRP